MRDIAFISGCGKRNRVVVRCGHVYYVGCFIGTKEEVIEAIKEGYYGEDREAYIAKIEALETMKLEDFTDVTAYGDYAIHWAKRYGHAHVISYLRSKGARERDNISKSLRT